MAVRVPAEPRVWVPGGTGMLGQALARCFERAGIRHTCTGREVDVGDEAALRRYADEVAPSHVVNCAGYTAVDEAERERSAAERVNALGAANLAALAAERGMALLHVSTDYVFDGRSPAPYSADAPCAPLNVYGHTKREGERAVIESMDPRTERRVHIVRTSWLFGPGGRNFVTTMLDLMVQRPALEVVADQHGRPTFTRDLADAIVAMTLRLAAPSGVYHFANAGETTWHGFASAILAAARRRELAIVTNRIEAMRTADVPRPALRPARSVLDTSTIEALGIVPRPWTEALDDYLGEFLP